MVRLHLLWVASITVVLHTAPDVLAEPDEPAATAPAAPEPMQSAAPPVAQPVAVPATQGAEPPPIVSPSPTSPFSTPDLDRDRARVAFRRGVDLMWAERWAEALIELERSYAALPTEAALVDAAVCLERLLRDDEALAKLREFQRRFGRRAMVERKRAVARAIERLESRDPRVAIRTNIPGATIRVDGAPIGRTPLLQPLSLRAGGHSIEASHPGRVTVVRHVILAPSERREVLLDLGAVASR